MKTNNFDRTNERLSVANQLPPVSRGVPALSIIRLLVAFVFLNGLVIACLAQTNFSKVTTGAIVTDGGASVSCIDIVRIEWPSGTAQEFHDVAPRQFLTIKEPARLLASMTNGIPYFSVKGWSGFQYRLG